MLPDQIESVTGKKMVLKKGRRKTRSEEVIKEKKM